MIRSVLVMGGGSAGFLAALTLKIRIPQLDVKVLRSKELGIIQVGESTTPTVGFHLHQYCGLDLKTFYRLVRPQWKIGIRFLWGPRPFFNYIFGREIDTRYSVLPRNTGFYLNNTEAFDAVGIQSQLMNENKVWLRRPDGLPHLNAEQFVYHLDNSRLVAYFEAIALERGITIVDDLAIAVNQDDHGVTDLRLKSGNTLAADLYVDASGFRTELLGNALKEPFRSYSDSLYCDRAVLGPWVRDDEPIQPYTTCETMDAGWCWRIDHEDRIDRGYVYSSSFISDHDAEAEFRMKNPKVTKTRVIPFRSGRHQRFWVKNVVAIGNAAAFVEPLESTSLSTLCLQCQALTEVLADCGLEPNSATNLVFNRQLTRVYDTIRDFLSVHYRFNRRLDTPFWRECLAKVEIHGARRPVEFYQENGPSALGATSFMKTRTRASSAPKVGW